ncbi:MAG TPA: hypothetical protein VEL31_27780 [Ktedonobacteraceae bacterium]|nr:hypothetical protein [Ktedonobacteraceae bacterium]
MRVRLVLCLLQFATLMYAIWYLRQVWRPVHFAYVFLDEPGVSTQPSDGD